MPLPCSSAGVDLLPHPRKVVLRCRNIDLPNVETTSILNTIELHIVTLLKGAAIEQTLITAMHIEKCLGIDASTASSQLAPVSPDLVEQVVGAKPG